jgi:ATP-dependent Clp protease ATP-binding subunit ClpC
LVTGLAHAIVAGTVPYFLQSQRILELRLIHFLDVGADVSFQIKRAKTIFNEVRRLNSTIVFLPDLIESLGVEGESATLRNLHSELVVTLRENQVPCILTASPGDYRRFVARRSSLDPFVQFVHMRPANRDETIEILNGVRSRFEEFHQVKISAEAIKAIVESADRRLPGALPGKAIQLLDRCAARTRIRTLSLSDDEAAAVRSIDEQLARLAEKLEEHVNQQDFQQAAVVRDEREKLKKSKDWLLQDKARDAVVHVELIEVVVRDLAVDSPNA